MTDLEIFVAVMLRLWWLWSILIGGMVTMMVLEYKEDVGK